MWDLHIRRMRFIIEKIKTALDEFSKMNQTKE
jgi:hypothetical protein